MDSDAGELVSMLSSIDEDLRRNSANQLREVAEERPEELEDQVDYLDEQIDPGSTDLSDGAYVDVVMAVGYLAKQYPLEVSGLSMELHRAFDFGLESGDVDLNIAAGFALGMLAKNYPDVASREIEKFVDVAEHEDTMVASNGMAMLGDLAEAYPAEVSEYLGLAVENLDSEDDHMRANTSLVVARTTSNNPDILEDHLDVEEVVDLLDDDFDVVRENACWTLNYLGWRADEAVDRLHEISETDDSERVRQVARQAIDNIVKPG